MMLRIKQWLAPPVFQDDENKTLRAKMLNHFLLTLLVLVLFIIAGNLAGGRVPAAVTGLNVVSIVLFFVLRHWNHQGRFVLAGGTLMAIGLVLVTIAIAILGTIRVPTTAMYILLVVSAGLLFDSGGMILMVVLCSLAVAGLIVVENAGLLPRPDYTVTITQWITYTVLFLWAGSLTFSSIQYMRQALAHADKEIIERKQTEEKLRKSEELFRKLVETEPECVKLLTKENILIEMNPAGLRIIEADSREQVLGRSVVEIIDPEYREAFKDLVRRIFKGDSALLEFRITGLKGTKRWLETHAVPLCDDNGKINLLLSITRDITERKYAEEELNKQHNLLEERVKERTAELAIAKERAEDSDRLKSAFLTTMSHELRTPLNSIIGFTGIILDGLSGPINDEQNKQLNMVYNSAKHLLSLIQDILDISKIESGQLKINITSFDMHKAIQAGIKTVMPLADKKGLALHVEVSPHEILIQSDQRRVEQIIFNLLGNAIKFTEKGGIKVECHIINGQVITQIIDTGIGIKPEHMNRLFRPFIQLDNGLSRSYEGTGLGLSICKKYVEILGGRISAESEIGKGSVFTFTLPLKRKAM